MPPDEGATRRGSAGGGQSGGCSPHAHGPSRRGEEALAFLKLDLVFLDLSLPKVDGYQVLEAMKADPALRRIPVVVISGSSREIDIARAYDAQVSAYLIKPRGVDHYFAAIRRWRYRRRKEAAFHLIARA